MRLPRRNGSHAAALVLLRFGRRGHTSDTSPSCPPPLRRPRAWHATHAAQAEGESRFAVSDPGKGRRAGRRPGAYGRVGDFGKSRKTRAPPAPAPRRSLWAGFGPTRPGGPSGRTLDLVVPRRGPRGSDKDACATVGSPAACARRACAIGATPGRARSRPMNALGVHPSTGQAFALVPPAAITGTMQMFLDRFAAIEAPLREARLRRSFAPSRLQPIAKRSVPQGGTPKGVPRGADRGLDADGHAVVPPDGRGRSGQPDRTRPARRRFSAPPIPSRAAGWWPSAARRTPPLGGLTNCRTRARRRAGVSRRRASCDLRSSRNAPR